MPINVNGYNRKLSALLGKHGLVEKSELGAMQQQANEEGRYLSALLVEGNYIDEMSLIGLIAEDAQLPPIDLSKIEIDIDHLKDLNRGQEPISQDDCKRFCVLPLALVGENLTLAVANPYDVVTLDDIKLAVGKKVRAVVSTESTITSNIENVFNAQEKKLAQFMDSIQDDGDLVLSEKRDDDADEGGGGEGDLLDSADGEGSPAMKLANMIILQAIQGGASDIHIEPFEKRVRIRFRIDGTLSEIMSPPKRMEGGLISRLKIMTDTMNIAEKGKPQDGRFQVKVAGRAVDFRVNSLPLVHGEKICMRILDKGNLAGSLESLCFEPQVLDIIRRSISSPYGMYLVTGPTGSGKSTTLYSALQAVMTIEDNVNTVEDPVEYEIDGLNQCAVKPKRGLTFAAALRALLRQDPDTIMIGEIRDKETIEIAVKAALTGHLVLSTLHTNDAPSTINRIVDMGIEPFLVANTVLAISAQRLGKRLCKACKRKLEPEEMPSREDLLHLGFLEEEIEGLSLYTNVGCSLCKKGYKGRFGIVECLEMTDGIKKVVMKGATNLEIREQAIKNGMVTLRRAALLNAARGITTIEDVKLRTVGENDAIDVLD